MQNFRVFADRIASDIAAGKIPRGTQLPTQRAFAYKHGIAVSTASRVYSELSRRGLIVGEVGRGSFIRSALSAITNSEPRSSLVDLEYNFPILPSQTELVTLAIEEIVRSNSLEQAMLAVSVSGSKPLRDATAPFLGDNRWKPDPDRILFTGNGRQAIAAALSASAGVGERVGVEAMTYPVVKGIIARLGLIAVPIAMDKYGMRPDAVAQAHRNSPLKAIYVQPILQNPLGATMSEERLAELAATLRRFNLIGIEDAVYSFLIVKRPPPLASYAPERVVYIESLSKRVSPGITLGFVVAPTGSKFDQVSAAIRAGAWTANGFALEFGYQWITHRAASQLDEAKRRDARDRQTIATKQLVGLPLVRDERSYHIWLELPDRWRADTFVSAAARIGIAVTPAARFAVIPGHSPNAVKLALASPPLDSLSRALKAIATLYNSDPELSFAS